MKVTQSCPTLFKNPWTVASQAPLSMEFSRQEYWSEWPFPSPGNLPNQGFEFGFPPLQAKSFLYCLINQESPDLTFGRSYLCVHMLVLAMRTHLLDEEQLKSSSVFSFLIIYLFVLCFGRGGSLLLCVGFL